MSGASATTSKLCDAGGRHDMRAGGEFLRRHQIQANCRQCMGTVAANQRGPRPGLPGSLVPTPLPALFPDAFNADVEPRRDFAAREHLQHRTGRLRRAHGLAESRLWAQDDWQISSNLTLNLGLRWDGAFNAFANDIALPPFQEAGRPNEMDNIQPRIGFAWKLGERTVIRGGTGFMLGCTRRRSVVCYRQRADRRNSVRQRRSRGFRGKPDRAAAADLRSGAAAVLLQQR